MSGDGRVSETPRHRRRGWRRRLSSGWRKTSVNVSLAPDSRAAGNKDGEASPESILNPNREKTTDEGKEGGSEHRGISEPRPLQAYKS